MKKTKMFVALLLAFVLVGAMAATASADSGYVKLDMNLANAPTSISGALDEANIESRSDIPALNLDSGQIGITPAATYGAAQIYSVVAYPLRVNTDGSLYYLESDREAWSTTSVSFPSITVKYPDVYYLYIVTVREMGLIKNQNWIAENVFDAAYNGSYSSGSDLMKQYSMIGLSRSACSFRYNYSLDSGLQTYVKVTMQ